MSVENTDYREESLDLKSPFDVKLVSKFLKDARYDLIIEKN